MSGYIMVFECKLREIGYNNLNWLLFHRLPGFQLRR